MECSFRLMWLDLPVSEEHLRRLLKAGGGSGGGPFVELGKKRAISNDRNDGSGGISPLTSNLKLCHRDFPGGPVVKNLSCNAGDTGPILGRGTKIPHASGQLSPRTTTTEPARLNYRAHALWSPRATTREKPVHAPQQSKEPTCCNERSRVLQLRPDVAKEQINKFKKHKKLCHMSDFTTIKFLSLRSMTGHL